MVVYSVEYSGVVGSFQEWFGASQAAERRKRELEAGGEVTLVDGVEHPEVDTVHEVVRHVVPGWKPELLDWLNSWAGPR